MEGGATHVGLWTTLQAIVVERPSPEDLICKKVSTGTANPKSNAPRRAGGHTKRVGGSWDSFAAKRVDEGSKAFGNSRWTLTGQDETNQAR